MAESKRTESKRMEQEKVESRVTAGRIQEEVQHQMRILLKGAEEIIGEEELRSKVERFVRDGRPIHVKFGLDPSAPDIHLGHTVALRKLKQMQDLGYHIIIVIGDFTGRIGDPTGKSKGRKALSSREVTENAQTYLDQIFTILDREKTEVRFNGEWLELLNLEEVIRLASTVTVARMLERDDFKRRYTENIPIGLHEFFYPLMQAYDSVVLEADIELGGTDQTFNVLMGRALQKTLGKEPQAALFMPILVGLDGEEKMSKSLGNYIGIKEDACVMFKKVMEVPDGLILRYFELVTDELPEDIDRIAEELKSGKNPRDVKLLLAGILTQLYHGKEETARAEAFYQEAFSRKAIPTEVPELKITGSVTTLAECIPQLSAAGFAAGNSELRRVLNQGGMQLNGEKIRDLMTPVSDGDVLRIGKKRFVKLKMEA